MTEPHPALAARRRRIHAVRRRVAAGVTALFIALFSGLYVQMASGHDPALPTSCAQVAVATSSSSSMTTRDPEPMTTQAS